MATEVSRRMGIVTQKWVEEMETELEAFRSEFKQKKEAQLMNLLEEKRKLYEERASLRQALREKGIEV